MITISYAVTVCDELKEIKRLLSILLESKREVDEVVVLLDLTKNEPESELLGYLHKLSSSYKITLIEDRFRKHFGDWKNLLTRHCKNDFIFQIDADEYPSEDLLELLPDILDTNNSDIYLVPRINTVDGLTEHHIRKWGWSTNEENHVNFPDYQWRLYKNNNQIKWKNRVHEVLEGYKTYSYLPPSKEYSLFHPKTIQRQEKQNTYYDTL